jgi:hypothetical protein
LPATPPIETWLAGAPLNAGNLRKYAVGGAATVGSPAEEPTASLEGGRFALTAVVRTDDPGIEVMAEKSENLIEWTTNGITMQAAADQTSVPAGCQRRIFSVPLSRNPPPRLFLRYRIVYSP